MIERYMNHVVLMLIMIPSMMASTQTDVEMVIGNFLLDKLSHRQLKVRKNASINEKQGDIFSIINGVSHATRLQIKSCNQFNNNKSLIIKREDNEISLKKQYLKFSRNFEFNLDRAEFSQSQLKFTINLNKLFEKKNKSNFKALIKISVSDVVEITNRFNNRTYFKYNLIDEKRFSFIDKHPIKKFSIDFVNVVKKWTKKYYGNHQISIQFEVILREKTSQVSLTQNLLKLDQIFFSKPQLLVYYNSKETHPNQCKPQAINIDLSLLRTHDFIYEPRRFTTYYCSGQCDLPFDSLSQASNQIILQSLIRNYRSYEYLPKACCVPIEFKPMQFIIKDSEGNLRVEQIDDMIVTKCGCR